MSSHQTIQQATEAVAAAVKATATGATVAAGGGAWAWFGTNSQAIGAVCAIVGALSAVIGLTVTLKRAHAMARQYPLPRNQWAHPDNNRGAPPPYATARQEQAGPTSQTQQPPKVIE